MIGVHEIPAFVSKSIKPSHSKKKTCILILAVKIKLQRKYKKEIAKSQEQLITFDQFNIVYF